MIPSILAAAENAAERSEAPFFIAGALLVAFAIVVSVLGFKRPDFPAGKTAARGVMGLAAVLVAAAMASAVYVSG